ncbi:MAG TPA: flagellar basal body L-ring protein FlgH, partial [Tepidisphaeraceae bacterium]|nr:flagellar basal body L-ring protein FlgH [Tepidisphaeraceae bacterium]
MKARIFAVILGCAGIALGQTSSSGEPEQNQQADAPPAPTREELAAMFTQSGGSLLRTQASAIAGPSNDSSASASDEFIQASFFAVIPPEPRVLQKMDLVTVIIREQSEFKSEGTTELTRDASLSAVINDFIKINLSNLELEPNIGSVKPTIDMNGKREFTGEGSIDRKDSFTARVQARVVDVKPNGTLVLESRKTIKTDDEIVVMSSTGGRTAYQNAGPTTRRGLEVALDSVWDYNLSSRIAYTLLDAKYDQSFSF